MKIIVDAMGGDNAPQEIVTGAVNAAKARKGLEIVLVGKEEEIRKALGGSLPERVAIVNATEVISMHDDPATAFKTKDRKSVV